VVFTLEKFRSSLLGTKVVVFTTMQLWDIFWRKRNTNQNWFGGSCCYKNLILKSKTKNGAPKSCSWSLEPIANQGYTNQNSKRDIPWWAVVCVTFLYKTIVCWFGELFCHQGIPLKFV
jgi:hypothetical protein